MPVWLTAALLLISSSCLLADSVVLKHTLKEDMGAQLVRLPNPNLEVLEGANFAGWQRWGMGYEADAEVNHRGHYSARCRSASSEEQRGLGCVVELNQDVPAPIVVECWSKAEGVGTGEANGYSLYLDLDYVDGTQLWAQTALFAPGTHDWERGRVAVTPGKPVKAVHIYALFRNRTGTAWFDDFRMWEQRPAGGVTSFDLIPVVAPGAHLAPGKAGLALRAEDGFSLPFGEERGEVLTIAPGGFFLRDAAANSDFIQPAGALRREPDGSLRYEAQDGSLQLRLSATFRVQGNAIRIDGDVQDLAGRDRAVTVYFSYPVDAVGWLWHDDQTFSRRIEPGQRYSNFVSRGAGANGLASRYPLACISGPDDGVVIGAPLDLPRLCRFGYNADSKELYAAVDLGLARDTGRFPSRASFSLVLYRCDPEWGFRSALERYYQLFPECFTKRNGKEGIWMPFTDIATVEGFQDFGFQFKEGDDNVAFDAAQGIYSFVYVEPWSLWLSMPPDMERTEERALGLIRERAEAGNEAARAWLTSAVEGPNGRREIRIEDQPWCNGAVLAVNPSPDLVPPRSGEITQFQHDLGTIERAFARSPALSGVYIDSFEMYLFPRALDYRREHFAQTRIPLVFDHQGRVCQSVMLEMVGFAREIADRMWPQGKMTFANGVPFEIPWSAAWLDVMGTEFGGFADRQTMNYWRALCYQRPYLLLLNVDFTQFPQERVARYMRRAAAYALFPSMFSRNASDDPYFRDPTLYNRDRPLFRKYVPIVGALSGAGWEPITYARTDRPQVQIERFGRPGGPLYFTLLNDSDLPQRATVTFDLAQLRPGATSFDLTELLSNGRLSPTVAGNSAVLEVDMPAQDTMVLSAAAAGEPAAAGPS